MRRWWPYPQCWQHRAQQEDEMNTYLNAAVATEHQQQLIADAATYRRSRTHRTVKAIRRRTRNPRSLSWSPPRFAA
jgi:hypothetical protein